MVKIPEQAFITVPPFRVVGNIHLPPEQNMRLALGEPTGGSCRSPTRRSGPTRLVRRSRVP